MLPSQPAGQTSHLAVHQVATQRDLLLAQQALAQSEATAPRLTLLNRPPPSPTSSLSTQSKVVLQVATQLDLLPLDLPQQVALLPVTQLVVRVSVALARPPLSLRPRWLLSPLANLALLQLLLAVHQATQAADGAQVAAAALDQFLLQASHPILAATALLLVLLLPPADFLPTQSQADLLQQATHPDPLRTQKAALLRVDTQFHRSLLPRL